MSLLEDTYISSINEDEYGRETLVKLISESIISKARKNPHHSLSIGILGEWGEGKTSLMKMIETELDAAKGIDSIWFNPWISTDSRQMIIDFFSVLIKTTNNTKLSSAISSYSRSLLQLDLHPSPAATSYMTHLRHTLPSNSHDIISIRDLISNLLVEENKHIVVFIDDIDRLFPTEIQTFFKLTRLLADFKNVIYVMGFDPKVVSHALGQLYNSIELGRDYLEKMIQVPYVLPFVQGERMKTLILNYLLILEKQYDINLPSNEIEKLSIGLSEVLSSKRTVIRFVNQMNLVLPVLHYEIDFEDLCYLESLKLVDEQGWFEIYKHREELLRIPNYELENKDIILNRFQEAVNSIVDHYPERRKNYVRKTLYMLFSTDNYLLSSVKKKIKNKLYFSQYFIFAVPDGLISRKEILALKEQIDNTSNYNIVVKWINEKTGDYHHSEIERSIISLLEIAQFNNKDGDTELLSAVMCKALAHSTLSHNYSCDSVRNPNTVTITISMNIIPHFMGHYDSENDAYDINSKLESKTLIEIFSDNNVPLNFCMNLLNGIYSDYSIKPYFELNVFAELKKRILKYGDLKLFDYSYVLKRTFMTIWMNLDFDDYKDYLKRVLSQPEFDAGRFIHDWLYASSPNGNKTELDNLKKLLLPVKNELKINLKNSKCDSQLLTQFIEIIDI